ncbi:MAG: Clp protease N-terminal domain-containing protein, partial [Bradymonadaceae bacterium]
MHTDDFTIKAREALGEARELCESRGHPEVEPLHLLQALLEQDDGIVPSIADKLGTGADRLREVVGGELQSLPTVEGGRLDLASSLSDALRVAKDEADSMDDEYVSTEHLLLALVQSQTDAGDLLRDQ